MMMKKHENGIPTTEKRVPNEMNIRKSNFKGLQSQAKSLNFVDILLSNDLDVREEMKSDDDEVDKEFDQILLNEEVEEDDDYDEAEFLNMSYEEIMDTVELPCHSNTMDADFDIENDEDDYLVDDDDDDDEKLDRITFNNKVSGTSIINSITNTSSSKIKNIDSNVKNLAVKNSAVRTKGKNQQSISQIVGVKSSTSSIPSGACGDQLPIDNYKDEIIQRVSRDRVTIIHGETGCGKSSRLPVILLEHAESCDIPCRMMISQPRRIAASSLMKRLRTTLGDKVGMRMGFGIKDETDETVITFVTTGYIVRLLAHHPEVFDDHTHLIIDEVHERSVDGDLLCLLARRLLQSNKNIHLILMSATIHTQLYKTYFSQQSEYYGDLECLSVGVRRFPINIKFIDDLSIPNAGFPFHITSLARDISAITKNCPNDNVPSNLAKLQYSLVLALVKMLGKLGTGILIFVSGIADITDLTEKFEGLDKFKVIAIHSDIPFEEQETAFLPAEPHEVKVIIATNAAESSITLPDVDCVLCLGTHKALQYHSTTHRVHLVNTWISKASATQRAGRTGRVRPGDVYRLYSSKLHAKFLEHEESEIQRTPLQDVILGLRSMLEDTSEFCGVVPVLEDLLEPPDTQNVANSFDVLFNSNMITTANDKGELTPIGRLSANLPVDLQLGRLISYGISLGVGPESIIVASALSQPKTLFRIASPFIHTNPDELNEIVRTSMLGAMHLDRGMYSEPLMHITLFIEWRDLMKTVKYDNLQPLYDYARKHGLAYTKVKAFYKSTLHLLDRVNESLGYHHSHHNNRNNSNGNSGSKGFSFNYLKPRLSKSKQNMLRLILIWSSEDNILSAKPLKLKSNTQLYTAQIDTPLSKEHLNSLFPKEVEWKFEGTMRKIYDAKFNRDEPRNTKQLLTSMISFSSSSECPYVPCVWIISHCKDFATGSNLTIISIAVLASDSILKRSEDDKIEYYTFCTAFSNEFLQKQKSEKKIERAPQPLIIHINNEEIGKDELSSASNITSKTKKSGDSVGKSAPIPLAKDIYDMYIIKQPSKSELKWWTDAHKFLNRSISLFIPLDDKEHAKLTDNNCFLSTSHLQKLFFGNSFDPALAFVSNSNNEQSDSKTPKKSYHIAEQVISSSQNKIVFPKPNIISSVKNQSATDEEDTLINDIPIGMRLLAAYKSMYKDKKLKFWNVPRVTTSSSSLLAEHASYKDSTKDTINKNSSGINTKSKFIPSSVIKANIASGKGKSISSSVESKNSDISTPDLSKYTSSVTPLVPGSAEWLKNKAKSVTQTNNENENTLKEESNSDDENKLTVTIQCVSTTWINLTQLGRLGIFAKPPTAMIGRQSPISVAVHCGQGALFAVAYNTMTVGTDARLVFVEGVTVLPPGNRWITLALKCLGKKVSNIVDSKSEGDEDEYDDDDDNDLNNDKKASSSNVKKNSKSKKETSNIMSTSNGNSTKENQIIHLDRSVTPDESKRCDLICQLLNNISMGPVKLAPDAIQLIRELFSDWISINDEGDEDAKEEDCYDNDEVDRRGNMRTQSLTTSSYNNNKVHIKNTSTNSKNMTADKTSKISNKVHKASKSDSNPIKTTPTILKRESSSTVNEPSNKLNTKSGNVKDIQLNIQRLSLSQSNSGSTHTVKKKLQSPVDTAVVTEGMPEPSDDYDYECDICHLYFMSPIKLYRHISKEHQHVDINSRLVATATRNENKGENSFVSIPEPSTVSSIPVVTTSQKSDTQSIKNKSKIEKQATDSHQSNSQNSFVCKICHRSFRLVIALNDHTAAAHSHDKDLFSLPNSTTDITNLVNDDTVGRDEVMDSDDDDDDDESSDDEDAPTKSMLCALYNSTRGCSHMSCDRLHLHPTINSPEWKSLKRQFRNLKRRSDYADLKPLPLLKFESTPQCSKKNQRSPEARARNSKKRRQRVRANRKAIKETNKEQVQT